MKNSEKKAIIILVLLIVLALFNNLIYPLFTSNSINYILIWIVSLGVSIMTLGFAKDKTLNKIDIIQIVVIYSFSYLIITYILGIVFGYTRSPFSLDLIKIIINITPILILIILQELFRYVILNKTNNSWITFLTICLFCILNITLNIKSYSIDSAMEIFELVGGLIIPTIITNILLTYLTKNAGYVPSIIYRLIFELYIYMVPVYPDFGIYISSLLSIIFPTIFFVKLNTCFAKKEYRKYRGRKLASIIVTVPLIACLTAIICLVSGLFDYYAIAVGSQSMVSAINKGDAVVVQRLTKSEIETLSIGDVIVYQHDNKLIIHRINKIDTANNTYKFYTKGDANDNIDVWQVNISDIKGKVSSVIRYVGYPSVWISEALK